MKAKLIILILISLGSLNCNKETIVEGIPECITKRINQIKAEGKWMPPAKVYRYLYKGQTVYFIPQHCCDIPSILLDEQCQPICLPNGGFTGRGDGKCSDFFTTRTKEQLIWQDSR